ncbi:alkaline phosphatase family protein [Petropleomorpha daqingensis]|uniref:Phospholipase C n=1 Tax=Petropleomorpha daqingensis TaxID=2026353 RepID=A0A853CD61_9ACTN|nr:alkaline phosphatase family protein [Petropleomorpha daqingensis]NYJ04996.1 phospholipase C [Petropleomorpha daqingensis]
MSRRRPWWLLLAVVVLAVPGLVGSAQARPGNASPYLPPARHVFVINLENKGFDETWGSGSAAPYLAQTLRAQGVLLTQYFGTAHNSLPNYLAQISGQAPNPQTQGDCQVYSSFVELGTVAPGQAVGQGCVYPADVPTLPGQLVAAGLSWKGYMEDMGTPCRHPALETPDDTQKAEVGDQYAARHNPFVYFRAITDSPDCAARDVDLSALRGDLGSIATTPNLAYITPNLCSDGHDAPCVDGRPGGLASADAWLRLWVPRILASPAFRRDGVLVITFDESDGPESDSAACCGEGPAPNTPLPGITGLGGGRVGALVISPFVRPGTWSTTPYNHYSLLASVEELFGLPKLGYAGTVNRFGLDVYTAGV